jgi:hypothetical protein
LPKDLHRLLDAIAAVVFSNTGARYIRGNPTASSPKKLEIRPIDRPFQEEPPVIVRG